MSYLNLPNPCLSAVLLTVSTHSGPQFVFNYPPVPTTIDTSLLKDRETELLSDSESDSEWSYSSDDSNDGSDSLANEEVIQESDGGSGDSNGRSVNGTTPEPQYRGMPGSLLERLERPRGSTIRRHHRNLSVSQRRRSSSSVGTAVGSLKGLQKKKAHKRGLGLSSTGNGRDTSARANGTAPHTNGNTTKNNTVTVNSKSGSGEGNIQDAEDLDITKVVGFDTDFLGELLCPQRAMCNMRFEMCVDDTVFLGLPIHVQADGQWRKKKFSKAPRSVPSTLMENGGINGLKARKRKTGARRARLGADGDRRLNLSGDEHGNIESTGPNETNVLSDENESDASDISDVSDVGSDVSDSDGDGDGDDGTKVAQEQGEIRPGGSHPNRKADNLSASISSLPEFSDPQSPMRMFQVTFVMTPPVTEYKFRVDQMYYFVLANFVKTLRTEQAKSNYVWNEVNTMLKIRDKALSTVDGNVDDGNNNGETKKKRLSPYELCDEMIEKSSLALAIAQLFNAIDISDIANLRINNKLRSFQIPIEYEFTRLPAITEPYLSRSYLTSISDFDNIINEGVAVGSGSSQFNVYCTILLLDSPDRIIKDIGVDPYSPLANFIRDINPTVTLQTLANTSGVEVGHVIELMRSLIYWRKARPIAPLHHRNIYAVSPLASIGQIYKYIPLFKEEFPALPSLPRMLSMLSTGKPRSYAFHIPSRDHRDVYLNALGWLFKYGFVMQLRTFVWLRVTKKIKMAVNRDIQNEEQLRESIREAESTNNVQDENGGDLKNTDTSTDNTSKRDPDNIPSTNNTTDNKATTSNTAHATTTTLISEVGGIKITSTTTPSASSNHLNELNTTTDAAGSTAGGKFSSSSSRSDVSDMSAAAEDWKQDTILLDPTTATLLQKKWINKITESKPAEVVALFNRVVKYFNGHTPMESVLLVENFPRQDFRKVLSTFDEFLIVVRHW
ncbi:Npr3p [Sugiyamaella lignohabitans]|uniref:Nitrogen permease regulator 3 n=1 Tax=Sugiyamaella lignohabitans TaxID=796027 RepID=A0A161HGZ2_9ASCO|nr:Npr3p [Sugiyamaella lignohabitans]ANB11187.1 Npr3p [Sugiyamaella lignohabitans]